MRLILFFTLLTSTLLAADNHGVVVKQYMTAYKDIAISEMHRTGVPASIKLAQGMLESNWGRSELATIANNHFGIKCGNDWTGKGFYKEDDDRDNDGNLVASCFRDFADAQESYIAHSDFLADENKEYRYGFLFELDRTDYKGWARGLKKAGYATDPKYPHKLISIIEKYNLSQYDKVGSNRTNRSKQNSSTTNEQTTISSVEFPHERETRKRSEGTFSEKESKKTKLKNTSTAPARDSRMPAKHISKLAYRVELNNDVSMVRAHGGETVQQLAAKVGLPLDELLTYNEVYIQKEEVLSEGAYIYIEKKKRKVYDGPQYHQVKEGETMESISQLYGIRLSSLYAKNRMPKRSTTIAGVKLFLNETASLTERPQFKLLDENRSHAFLFEDDPTVE